MGDGSQNTGELNLPGVTIKGINPAMLASANFLNGVLLLVQTGVITWWFVIGAAKQLEQQQASLDRITQRFEADLVKQNDSWHQEYERERSHQKELVGMMISKLTSHLSGETAVAAEPKK